jgi:hypothetical protein
MTAPVDARIAAIATESGSGATRAAGALRIRGSRAATAGMGGFRDRLDGGDGDVPVGEQILVRSRTQVDVR